MRLLFTGLLLVFALAGPATAESQDPRTVTGLQWLEMSLGARMDVVVAGMYMLDQAGVEFPGSPNDYYNGVDKRLKRDPSLYEVSVASILAGYVYDTQPQSRETLDRFRSKAKRTKVETH